MNCRQCKHLQDVDGWNSERGKFDWPCARGVASLPELLPEYSHSDAFFDLGDVPLKFIWKLPWMIDHHECPEFDENS